MVAIELDVVVATVVVSSYDEVVVAVSAFDVTKIDEVDVVAAVGSVVVAVISERVTDNKVASLEVVVVSS